MSKIIRHIREWAKTRAKRRLVAAYCDGRITGRELTQMMREKGLRWS